MAHGIEIVFDTESDGFRDDATQLWCVCLLHIGESVEEYGPDRLDAALRRLDDADVLIGHNIIDHDLPLMERLHGWRPKPHVKIIDTLVKSRLLRSDRSLPYGCPGNVGPHSLCAWGYRVGRGKPDHDDWTVFSPEMLHRCSEDTVINGLVHYELLKEEANLFEVDWTQALEVEHGISPIITQQELNGCPLDLALVWSTRRELKGHVLEIDKEVVPLIPEVALPKSSQPAWPTKQYKKDGQPTVQARKYYGDDFGLSKEYRTDIIVRTAPISLSSNQQVKNYLLGIGWIPTEWNFKKGKDGKPIRNERGDRIRTSPKLQLESLE